MEPKEPDTENVVRLDDYRTMDRRGCAPCPGAAARARLGGIQEAPDTTGRAHVDMDSKGILSFRLMLLDENDIPRLLNGCQKLVTQLIRRLPGATSTIKNSPWM
jgi:hypothetical protein